MSEKMIRMTDPLLKPAMEGLETALNVLLLRMNRQGYKEGKVSLTINLKLESTEVMDPATGEIGERQTPRIRFKAKYGMSESNSVEGSAADDTQVLSYDEHSGKWFMTACEKAQKSMF